MKRFVIHIGPHKTGTTYLQLQFRWARAKLAQRGIAFPEVWEHAPGNPSHLKLVHQLRDNKMDLLAPRMQELLSGKTETVLLSAEDLSNLDDLAMARLKQLIDGHEVRILFYARRWSELVPSSWQEGIKHGQSHTLPEFMLQHVMRVQASRLLNFDLKLSRFAKFFGPDSVQLVSYSELRDRKLDLFQHFAATFLDWPDAEPRPRPGATNASRTPLDVELLRALNALSIRRHGEANAALRRRFDLHRAELDLEAVASAVVAHAGSVRFADDSGQMRSLHRYLLRDWNSRLVAPHPDDMLFKPKLAKLPYVHGDYLLCPGVVAALNAALDRLEACSESDDEA